MTGRPSAGTVAAGSVYVVSMVALTAMAAWPLYRSPRFLVLVIVSAAVAAGIAGLVTWFRRDGWTLAALLVPSVLILGVPLGVPGRPLSEAGPALGEVAAGILVGWKDLLTVDLPLGDYRNLLVPALVVFLVGTAVALWTAWRPPVGSGWAVVVTAAMAAFGLVFGPAETSDPVQLGPVRIVAPTQIALGVGSLVLGVWWLGWRTRQLRRSALVRAARTSGVRMRRAGPGRAFAPGAAIVLVAALGVTFAVPAMARPREVLRDAVGPRVELSREPSPLSGYRSLFRDAVFDEVLFTVDSPAGVDRVRLAVLDEYDGAVFRTGDGAFVRVPASRDAGPGTPAQATVTIGGLSGLWMPVLGSVVRVTAAGDRSGQLSDGFFYNAQLDAAVQTVPWRPGDRYAMELVVPPVPALAAATAPGGQQPTTPASLREWMQRHSGATGGAALVQLIDALRAEGYLSHGLDGRETRWQAALGDYTFAASASGHSLARIDGLFQALLNGDSASGGPATAAGDDEQFAVAAALIAGELGFPARIVLGARLHSAEPELPVCEDGRCRSGDVAAWLEVRAADGAWIPIDVTPQHTVLPERDLLARPEPRIGTEVRPDTVSEVVPAPPDQRGSAASEPPPEEPESIWPVLRGVGLVAAGVMILAAPALLVLSVKAWRRRRRSRRGTPAERIAAGWDEYRDAATDAGSRVPAAATRREAAAVYATPAAETLAMVADRAVFSDEEIDEAETERFWAQVHQDRRAFAPRGLGRWRAALSLRSLRGRGPRRDPSRGGTR